VGRLRLIQRQAQLQQGILLRLKMLLTIRDLAQQSFGRFFQSRPGVSRQLLVLRLKLPPGHLVLLALSIIIARIEKSGPTQALVLLEGYSVSSAWGIAVIACARPLRH
jgi:hypothetical protein